MTCVYHRTCRNPFKKKDVIFCRRIGFKLRTKFILRLVYFPIAIGGFNAFSFDSLLTYVDRESYALCFLQPDPGFFSWSFRGSLSVQLIYTYWNQPISEYHSFTASIAITGKRTNLRRALENLLIPCRVYALFR